MKYCDSEVEVCYQVIFCQFKCYCQQVLMVLRAFIHLVSYLVLVLIPCMTNFQSSAIAYKWRDSAELPENIKSQAPDQVSCQ